MTAGELWQYSKDALETTLRGRNQTPDIMGKENAFVGISPGEKGPNLSRLAQTTAGAGAREEMFRVSNLPQVPRARAPEAVGDLAGGADWRSMDVDALGKYDEATKFDESDASAEAKADKWRALASAAPSFAEKAGARAAQWDRYAQELPAEEEARQKRAEARDKDWEKLGRLLAMKVVPAPDKSRWAAAFASAYGKTSEDNPYVAELEPYLPPGTVKVVPGQPGVVIWWVTIPGGSFMMGSGDGDAKPRHEVHVAAFKMAKTLVTAGQYKKCVKAGKCKKPNCDSPGDDHPVVCVNWEQAKKFSEWVGGRLPSEAEWEYAARSAGKDWKYPWGNEDATCERAVISGCGSGAAPVCSKPAGNTAQGLCDMAGNVWEWTQDWYHDSYKGAPTDGSAWESPAGSFRVDRGGSWDDGARRARATFRGNDAPGNRYGILGFRPSRSR